MILLEPANTIPHLNMEIKRRTISLTGISVNSTNALPYFDFFGCDCYRSYSASEIG